MPLLLGQKSEVAAWDEKQGEEKQSVAKASHGVSQDAARHEIVLAMKPPLPDPHEPPDMRPVCPYLLFLFLFILAFGAGYFRMLG